MEVLGGGGLSGGQGCAQSSALACFGQVGSELAWSWVSIHHSSP